jgi:hypothetical protein
VQHLLRHGTSGFKVISERLVILTSLCRSYGEGAITTYCKHLRFDVAGTSVAQLTTSLMLSKNSIAGLRQPLHVVVDIRSVFQQMLKRMVIINLKAQQISEINLIETNNTPHFKRSFDTIQ